MQFIYRLGVVVIGTTVFAGAYLIFGILWVDAHADHTRNASAIYLVAYSWPMLIPSAVVSWLAARLWRWICGVEHSYHR